MASPKRSRRIARRCSERKGCVKCWAARARLCRWKPVPKKPVRRCSASAPKPNCRTIKRSSCCADGTDSPFSASLFRARGKPFDSYFASGTDLHFQLVPTQESHANQRGSAEFGNGDGASFAIPHYLPVIYVMKTFASVSQDGLVHSSPTQTQGSYRGGIQRQKFRISRVNEGFDLLLLSLRSYHFQVDTGLAFRNRASNHNVSCS